MNNKKWIRWTAGSLLIILSLAGCNLPAVFPSSITSTVMPAATDATLIPAQTTPPGEPTATVESGVPTGTPLPAATQVTPMDCGSLNSGIVGTWQRTSPAEKAGASDLMASTKIQFFANGAVIFSPMDASGTYFFPDCEHILFAFPGGGVGYKLILQNNVLSFTGLNGKTTVYKKGK